ncbi:copper chaperone PCu(A)C [Erythrobacteraceae bacterium CFH 75059]|uniref:copper chaperone PCu(A)C n=1 Tax=Qipengyuania thermophila TaxID=2509361 RepID=UPI0010211A21|nr:copper chaperone PCu(A)C [Qipengyuania thermophila]TCD05184.1 copper chaperone PCu(A)C [Erythrobacteraceae bacterium CFH 75059]
MFPKASLATLFLLAASVPLVSCNEAQPAGEVANAGLEITNARLVLNAVQGNPAAVYFDAVNRDSRAVTIRGASVAGAQSAQLHEYQEWDGRMVMGEMAPLSLQPGETVSFAPGGRHVMVFGPPADLQPGGEADVTLTLLGNRAATFRAAVLPPGGGDHAGH